MLCCTWLLKTVKSLFTCHKSADQLIARSQVSISSSPHPQVSHSPFFSHLFTWPSELSCLICYHIHMPPTPSYLLILMHFLYFSGFIWQQHGDMWTVSVSSSDTMLTSRQLMPLVSSGWMKAIFWSCICLFEEIVFDFSKTLK